MTDEKTQQFERLTQQVAFLVEIDKLKSIIRQSPLVFEQRKENDAEHSWHFALMAVLLTEYSAEPEIDLLRVVKMILIHDLVEIDAGDAFVYDAAAMAGKEERELRAADRIFNLLPADQAQEIRALWDEFEERATPEARYAYALDRFHPMLQNYMSGGRGWREHDIARSQVIDRNKGMMDGAPLLWEYALTLVEDATARGDLRAEHDPPRLPQREE